MHRVRQRLAGAQVNFDVLCTHPTSFPPFSTNNEKAISILFSKVQATESLADINFFAHIGRTQLCVDYATPSISTPYWFSIRQPIDCAVTKEGAAGNWTRLSVGRLPWNYDTNERTDRATPFLLRRKIHNIQRRSEPTPRPRQQNDGRFLCVASGLLPRRAHHRRVRRRRGTHTLCC